MPTQRLDSGQAALFYGDWNRAVVEFQAAAAGTTDAVVQADAIMGWGHTLLQMGRLDEAVQQLNAAIDLAPDHPRVAYAYYWRAQANQQLGLLVQAADDYSRYLELNPGILVTHVQTLRGNLLFEAEDYAGARAAFQLALQDPAGSGNLYLETAIANTYVKEGDRETAIAQYLDIYDRTSNEYLRAELNLRLAYAYLYLGRNEEAYTRLLDSVENYPLAYDTYVGLTILVEDGVPVDELDRGLVDYYAGQYEVAVAAFDRYLAQNPSDPGGTARYFRGMSLRAMGNAFMAVESWQGVVDNNYGETYWDMAYEELAYTQWAYLDQYTAAVETLLAFVEAAPEHPRAPEFLFDAALVSELDDNLEQAVQLWDRLATAYPAAQNRWRALFLAGVTLYRLGDYDLSRVTFQRALQAASGPEEQAASHLWIGKTYQIQGNQASAEDSWRTAVSSDPSGYYGLRAADLVQGRAPFETTGVYNFQVDLESERLEAEQWMRAYFQIDGPEPLTELEPSISSDPRFMRGQELWQLGMYGEARQEFENLRLSLGADAEATYRLMHYFLDNRVYQPAIYMARHLMELAGLNDDDMLTAPVYFNRIRFGPYFGDLILPEALAHGFDGLYVLSVVRQESLFEPFATSYASAYGLMQVIPSTGQSLADRLGWPPDFTSDDLYRPIVSVRLGVQYLADQRDYFEGDLVAALAAYNAGPGNAATWKAMAPDDPDLFLEIIRFSQPRDYIRVIYWAFTRYRDLYVQP
jgi:soluble lytic murein transglycosylase